MLHNRGQAHGKRCCQLRNRSWTLAEPHDDGPPGWVRERLENRVKLSSPGFLGLLIVKHILKYRRNVADVNRSQPLLKEKSVRRREYPGGGRYDSGLL